MIEKFCKKSFLILVLALFAATFWATDHARGETIMVEDMAGRSVSVESPVQRIVCAGPGALRLITYMNVQDKVVGVEEMEKDPTGRPYAYANPCLLYTSKLGLKPIGVVFMHIGYKY